MKPFFVGMRVGHNLRPSSRHGSRSFLLAKAAIVPALAMLLLNPLSVLGEPQFVDNHLDGNRIVVEIRQLLAQGKAQDAYARALQLENQLIGEPSFDFYFGLAAVESGEPSVAALAFERVLLAEPGSARVQLELGRALYQLGDFEGAQRQFYQVLDQEPPAGVRTTINQFLEAMASHRRRQSRQLQWGLSLESGYDSNINSATSADEFTFALGTVIFPSESQKTDDGFSKLSGFFNGQLSTGDRSGWFFNTAVESLGNWSTGDYNTDVWGAHVGYQFGLGPGTLRTPVNFQAVYLDGEANRYSGGVGLDWSWPFASNAQAVFFGQTNALRNPDNLARDSNLYVMGGGLSYFVPDWRTQFLASVSFGKDHALNDPVFGKLFATLRLGGKWWVTPQIETALDLDFQSAHYEEQGAFLTEREDVFAGAAMTVRYAFAQHWRVALRSSYTDNHSNLALYDYDRAVFSLTIDARW